MGKRKPWCCFGAAILLVAAISSASPRGAGFLPLPSSTRDPLLQCTLSMLGRRGELRGGRRARKGGAVERGLSPIAVLDLRSMHMGGSLHMRGGAPGGHSAIFAEDTKKRKAAKGGEQRSVQEILQGAMLRGKRRTVGGWESLSLSELKVKLKELGVEQRKIAACFERSQLEELLRGAVDAIGGGEDAGNAHDDGDDDSDGDGVADQEEDRGEVPDRAASGKCAGGEIQEARDLRVAAKSLPPGVLDGIIEEDEGVVSRILSGSATVGDCAVFRKLLEGAQEDDSDGDVKGGGRKRREVEGMGRDGGGEEGEGGQTKDEEEPEVVGPILEIREGCSDDDLDEEERAIVGEQKGRASYDASRVSMAQSRYESAVTGTAISQEERVVMARDVYLKNQAVRWLRNQLESLGVSTVGMTEKWELVTTLRSHPGYRWDSVDDASCHAGGGRKPSQDATTSGDTPVGEGAHRTAGSAPLGKGADRGGGRVEESEEDEELPPEVDPYESSTSSQERARYGLPAKSRDSGGKRDVGSQTRVRKPWQFAETSAGGEGRIKVHVNDRLGWKTWVWAKPSMTIGQLKIVIATKLCKNPQILRLQFWYNNLSDKVTLSDYEIHDGTNIDLYYEDALESGPRRKADS